MSSLSPPHKPGSIDWLMNCWLIQLFRKKQFYIELVRMHSISFRVNIGFVSNIWRTNNSSIRFVIISGVVLCLMCFVLPNKKGLQFRVGRSVFGRGGFCGLIREVWGFWQGCGLIFKNYVLIWLCKKWMNNSSSYRFN